MVSEDKYRYLEEQCRKWYNDSEKSRLMTKRFIGVSQELGMTVDVLAVHVHDMSVARGADFMEVVEQVCENGNAVLKWMDDVNTEEYLLSENPKGLSRMSLYRIRKNHPVGTRLKAYEKCDKKHKNGIPSLKVLNNGYSFKKFGKDFFSLVLLSCLCNARDSGLIDGMKVLPLSMLWKMMNQSERWNAEAHKLDFANEVGKSVTRINKLFNEERGFSIVMEKEGITMTDEPSIWTEAKRNRQLMQIPKELLPRSSRLYTVVRVYIATRILKARKYDNFDCTIRQSTLYSMFGDNASERRVEGYFRALQSDGVIKSYENKDGRYKWVDAKKQPSEPRSTTDHIDMPEDGESGSESKQTPEETTI